MHSNTLQKNLNSTIGKHWRKDGEDYIADLGTLKKAIVIRLFVNKLLSKDRWFSIAMASNLPFTEEEYDKRFDADKPYEAIAYAEGIVKAWMQSLFITDSIKQDEIDEPFLTVAETQKQ